MVCEQVAAVPGHTDATVSSSSCHVAEEKAARPQGLVLRAR